MLNFTPSAEQNDAIQFPGNMVIIARPGSGKTSVLSRKVRSFVSGLRRHQGIIAISFTNKASDELERRCKADAFDVKSSFFGTIDDFCLREIVYPFARQLMHVAATPATAKLRELPEDLRRLLPVTPIEDGTVANTSEFLPFLQAALAQGIVPLETVGMLARYVVEHSVACRNYLVARYCAVYIDEYQDSGYFQHQLFLKLNSLGMTAVAVGDSDQSIYGFAHKDSRFLVELTVQGSGFAHFLITTNFRSHPSINDFALRLLNPNHPIAPTNDMRMLIKTVNGHQGAMGLWLETAIPHLMRLYQVDAASRVAILCRNQHSAQLIAGGLGLVHHLIQDNPFTAAPPAEISVFSELLKLRFDEQMTAEALIERFVLASLAANERRSLRRTLLGCRTCQDSELVAALLSAASFLLARRTSAEGAMELASICRDPELLRRFQNPSHDAIQIMTLHKAKGLEFELVFHADLHDHVIPKRLYPPGQYGVFFENESQCLNLHYVGVTRAIKACVLMTSSLRINGQGDIKNGAPSQFIGRNGAAAATILW